MKKWLKIVLISVGIFAFCIVIDIVSIYTLNKPIFAIKDDCDCTDQVYKGLLYDTYNCWEYPTPQIKMKWNKFSCAGYNTQNIIIGKIIDVKDKYVVVNSLSDNNFLKASGEAEITLENNPNIKGANNLIIGQYIKLYPTSIAEVYPIIITTNEIEVISEEDANMLIKDNSKVKDTPELNEIDNVSMTIKEGTLTKTGATVIINDSNGSGTYIYGTEFRVDKKENGEWKELEYIHTDFGFTSMAYYVDEIGKLEFDCDWEYMYGELSRDEYRIVKHTFLESDTPITNEDYLYFSVEFTIE